MRCQLDAAALLQMLMYFVLLRRLVKKNISNGWMLCLCIAEAGVAYLYEDFLGSMDLSCGFVDETLYATSLTAIPLCISLAGILLSVILPKLRAKTNG